MSHASHRQDALAGLRSETANTAPQERGGLMIDFFVDVLAEMSPERIRSLREQVIERFRSRDENAEACDLMIELIDAHLRLRSRRSAKGS